MLTKTKRLILILVVLSSTAHAQVDDLTIGLEQIESSVRLQRQNAENANKYSTPQEEVKQAIVFLSSLPASEAHFIRFFTTYSVKPEYRNDLILTLSFVIHSLVGPSNNVSGNNGSFYPLARTENGSFVPYRKVSGSETLWWIDLREYNWTPQAWENVAKHDPYFREPIISHDVMSSMRLLAGNAVLRADWFIYHVMQAQLQQDFDIEENFYHELLYAMVNKPQNIKQFQEIWGLDINKSRRIGNEYAVLATKSKNVSRHNRLLFGYRTEIGYLYQTYDVKNSQGKKDLFEALFLSDKPNEPPAIFDAGEAFATNQLGLQVYFLYNGQGNSIQFGDPTLVRNINDNLADVRVRVPHSCVVCHSVGPLPAENTFREFIDSGGDLLFANKIDLLKVHSAFLSGRFENSVPTNQAIFANAVKKTNGLDTSDNLKLYLQAIRQYGNDVTIEQAALECGVTVDAFKKAVTQNSKFGGRLKLLAMTGEPIPRETWDSPGKDGIPGMFQQAFLLIQGKDAVLIAGQGKSEPIRVIQEIETVNPNQNLITGFDYVILYDNVPVYSGNRTIAKLRAGQRVRIIGQPTTGETQIVWLPIETENRITGYVRREYVVHKTNYRPVK